MKGGFKIQVPHRLVMQKEVDRGQVAGSHYTKWFPLVSLSQYSIKKQDMLEVTHEY